MKTDTHIDTVSAERNSVIQHELIVLKNISLEKNVIERLGMSRQLKKDDLKLFSIPLIDTMTANEFKYHLFDTLFWGSQAKIVLIGRKYIEENIIWAVSYDANNNPIDHLQVYYDNSEGSLTVLSAINNNFITINNHADEDEEKQKAEVYKLTEANKFVRQE